MHAGLSMEDQYIAAVQAACKQRNAQLLARTLHDYTHAVDQLRSAAAVRLLSLLQLVIAEPHPANYEIVSLLLAAGANVRLTPCILAHHLHALADQMPVLRLLLQHGADESYMGQPGRPGYGLFLLHKAAGLNFDGRGGWYTEAADQTLIVPCDLFLSMKEACAHALDICRTLTQHGADVGAICMVEGYQGLTPPHIDCCLRCLPWLHALLACGARVDIHFAVAGYYPLHLAMDNILAPKDADITQHGSQGLSQQAVTKALLDAGAEPNLQDALTGQTVLHMACIQRQPHVVQMLLKRGASMHVKTPWCHTNLHGCYRSLHSQLAAAPLRPCSRGRSYSRRAQQRAALHDHKYGPRCMDVRVR